MPRETTEWKRRCGACGSDKVTSKYGLFHCLECKHSETEDPWSQCPCCQGQLERTKIFKVGAYVTGSSKCTQCNYRITFESRVTHQQAPGQKQPGPYKWMSTLMGRVKTREP